MSTYSRQQLSSCPQRTAAWRAGDGTSWVVGGTDASRRLRLADEISKAETITAGRRLVVGWPHRTHRRVLRRVKPAARGRRIMAKSKFSVRLQSFCRSDPVDPPDAYDKAPNPKSNLEPNDPKEGSGCRVLSNRYGNPPGLYSFSCMTEGPHDLHKKCDHGKTQPHRRAGGGRPRGIRISHNPQK